MSSITLSAAFSAGLAGKKSVEAQPDIAKTLARVMLAAKAFPVFMMSGCQYNSIITVERGMQYLVYAGKTPVER